MKGNFTIIWKQFFNKLITIKGNNEYNSNC